MHTPINPRQTVPRTGFYFCLEPFESNRGPNTTMNLYDTYENEFELSVSTLRDMINEYKTVQNPKVVKQIDAEFDVAKGLHYLHCF